MNESKEKIFKRKIAHLGMITSSPPSLLLKPLFLDSEIINISKIEKEEIVKFKTQKLKIAYSENGKTVLHQQAMKSCGQTCVSMLLLDLGFSPDFKELRGHLTTSDQRKTLIENQPEFKELRSKISSSISDEFLKTLQKKILEQGSAIVGIDGLKEGRIGGHVLICDEVSSDLKTVRIRDPWQGWEINLNANAFLDAVYIVENNIYYTEIQQIQKIV